MTNKQLAPKVRAWLKSTDVPPEDARRSVGIVSGQAERTRQRGRWWPLPSFRRWTEPPSTSAPTRPPSSPILAANGRAPTVIGRTQIMFSPVKAITAGALVFALGGLFLVAQPFDQGGSVPGAEQAEELADSVEVTITYTDGPPVEDSEEVCTDDGGYERCTGVVWSHLYEATDPRLSGTATYRVNEVNTGVIFEAYAIELVNDEGTWVGTGRHVSSPVDATLLTLTGEGPYEGFSAVVFMDTSGTDDDDTMKGVIIEGELPPFPEPIE